ncbi:unnamed protein product [Trifolium pratense]|uniref:Uncharacterized protein n=1 Tax=Trifolium pratense TaxID=57577 RepID=A0ACB0LP88_TRIPR|nr:unnamed protein product [Trifolium pratense]
MSQLHICAHLCSATNQLVVSCRHPASHESRLSLSSTRDSPSRNSWNEVIIARRQHVCSVPRSIEALTHEIERDPEMSHKEKIWTKMPQMRWLHKWHQLRANKDSIG